MPHESTDRTALLHRRHRPGRTGRATSPARTASSTSSSGKPGSKANPKANPETLFAAGYAACFGNRRSNVGGHGDGARRLGLRLSRATVTLGKTDTGVGLAVALGRVGARRSTAAPRSSWSTRRTSVCPYSKATRGNIDVTVALA